VIYIDDSSHRWFANRAPENTLRVFIGDATVNAATITM
jgi:hypothetical protein